jgi:hypothetical protein
MKKVFIFMLIVLVVGCATAKPNDYCRHDEVMVIEVQNDNYVVKCYNPAVELDRPRK